MIGCRHESVRGICLHCMVVGWDRADWWAAFTYSIIWIGLRSTVLDYGYGSNFPSLPVFRQRLKTFLFHKSFPDVVCQADYAFVDLVMAYCYSSRVENCLID